jgi:3D (Asp-Asp-Asp) domain-containing protein
MIGPGLPLSAHERVAAKPMPSASSKAGDKGIPISAASTAASLAQAKAPIRIKAEVIVTPDVCRGAVSLTLLSKQESLAPAPEAVTPSPSKTAGLVDSGKTQPIRTESHVLTDDSPCAEGRLARVTAYWAAEGDYYTERHISSTGVRLHDGHCAVDPSIIPYGSVVEIAGVGKFLAVDTGSAVISRTAAREGGHTFAERHAIVVDLYFEDRCEGERFAAGTAKYVAISWYTPNATGIEARAARSLFAEEDWTKIQSKQL